MRTVDPQILSDFNDAKATKLQTRVRLYDTRVFFRGTDLVTTHAPAWADPIGIPEQPVSQDLKYNLQIGKPFTVVSRTALYCGFIDQDLLSLVSGGLPLATSAASRPSSWSDATQTIIYYHGSDMNIHKLTVDAALIDAGTADAVIADEVIVNVQDLVAIHGISDVEIVYLKVSDGGVAATYVTKATGAWVEHTWPLRFMHPTHNYTNFSQDDQYALNFSGGVKNGTSIFIYLSGVDGNVLGVERKADGSWSDVFEAMPADLSMFKISNAMLAPNGTIHLVGQFQRVDPEGYFGSTWIYCLDLWSYEGRTFSLDRFTMFSLGDTSDAAYPLGYRFQMAVKPGTPDVVYYSDLNRYLTDNAPYAVSSENATVLTIPDDDVIRTDVTDTAYTIRVANGLGTYDNNPLFRVGTIVKLDLGSRDTYFQYMDLILTDVTAEIADGKRSLTLHAMPNTLWRTSSLTHPFYLEIQSKQSVYAKEALLDTLYKASEDGHLVAPLYVDFWGSGAQPPLVTDAAAETVVKAEMSTYDLTDNPKVSQLPFHLNCYGWGRAGDTTDIVNGGGDIPTDPNATNAEVYVRLKVLRDMEEITVDCKTFTSTYNHWPRTWYTAADGSLPVIIECQEADGLALNDEILEISMVLKNNNAADKILSVPERIESTELVMYLAVHEETWKEIKGGTIETGKSLVLNAPVDAYNGAVHTEIFQGSGDKINFRVTFAGEWPATNRACSVRLSPQPPWGTYNFSYDCIGTWPSANWDQAGDRPPDLSWATYIPKPVNGVVRTPIAGGYRYSGTVAFTAQWFPDGNMSLGWGQDNNGRWAGTTIREGYVTNFMLNGVPYVPELVEEPVAQELMRIGLPIVYLATKPYNTFDFEVAAQLQLIGAGAWGGVVGLAKDGLNYLAARASTSKVQILKVRNGIETILAEANATHASSFWILFTHHEGQLTVYLRDTNTWTTTPVLTYAWTEADGTMAVDQDLMHVGIYALRETPWARITGYDSANGQIVGVLPGSDLSQFPANGIISMNGLKYQYTGKLTSANLVRGPFQARNTGLNWGYTEDGRAYSGNSVEFTLFEYLTNSVDYAKYVDRIMSFDNGYAWKILSTDYKPWTKTAGNKIYLHNRSRHFGEGVAGDHVGMNQRAWIVDGFTGVSLLEGEPQMHDTGEIVHLDNSSRVILKKFTASSGHEDCTVEDMLAKVVQLAGGQSKFPGDKILASKALTTSAWRLA